VPINKDEELKNTFTFTREPTQTEGFNIQETRWHKGKGNQYCNKEIKSVPMTTNKKREYGNKVKLNRQTGT